LAKHDDGLQGELLPEGEGKLYYRIGEVSRITGVKPYVLRYWESEFRWMAPQKSRSRQRLYRKKDIEMIVLIKKLLYEERFTIAGARKRLKELGVSRARAAAPARAGVKHLRKPSSRPIDHRASYRQIKQDLLAIRAML
jgi:DNA-binding transcriptional MerR regulator